MKRVSSVMPPDACHFDSGALTMSFLALPGSVSADIRDATTGRLNACEVKVMPRERLGLSALNEALLAKTSRDTRRAIILHSAAACVYHIGDRSLANFVVVNRTGAVYAIDLAQISVTPLAVQGLDLLRILLTPSKAPVVDSKAHTILQESIDDNLQELRDFVASLHKDAMDTSQFRSKHPLQTQSWISTRRDLLLAVIDGRARLLNKTLALRCGSVHHALADEHSHHHGPASSHASQPAHSSKNKHDARDEKGTGGSATASTAARQKHTQPGKHHR
eukprot:CAMPEP_0119391052 /NCGR_PEP_ID=MMETSP1334-20130426/115701_1 /TAXON_ID=127549 /ORGANISM="Calcidiscus leptoporus, Strain RCC1130" /LENGTH=276 /DNA_ID=CAMNT_0007413673 /DNA_START=79 /DNA_END=909 /DNA_ORIENTATION=+